jgi:hypothetical protein
VLDVAGLSGDGGFDFVTEVKDLFRVGLLASGMQGGAAIVERMH